MWAAAVVVWLLWVFMAWCLGYAAGHRRDRARHSRLTGPLAPARLERVAALEQLDELDEHARLRCEAHRVPAPPVAVHVHVAAPLPWPPHHPAMPLDGSRVLDAMPVLPVKEVQP
jgi:hypothetical protein